MGNFMMEDEERGQYDDVFYVKAITKKDETPRFQVKQKKGTMYETLDIEPSSLSGVLKKIEFSEYEWEGKQIETVKFNLEKETDGVKQLSIFTSSYTSTLRTIINCLLNYKDPIKNISFILNKNKDGYNGIILKINSKSADWKYKYEFFKTMIDVEKTRKGDVLYYDKLDAFLKEELIKHIPVILPDIDNELDNLIDDEPTDPIEPSNPEDIMKWDVSDIEEDKKPLKNKRK